jgi:outer membrane receptor for ferrienterochelin and colicin
MYNYSVESRSTAENAFTLNHNINYSNLKADFNWYKINNHRFNFGIDINRYVVLPGEYLPASDSSLVAMNIIEKERAIEGAIYAEDKIRITDKLSLNVGLRFSLFSAIGPHKIMLYDPEQPMTQSSVTDTLNINSGKIFKTYAGPEYRVSVNYKLSENSSIKLNYNRTRQYLHLLSNSTSISPTDTWKLSDYYLKPQRGDQFALGYYLEFPKHKFEMSAEVYYKKIKDMIDFKGGTNLIMNQNIEKDIINVEGKAYGLELMLKKSLGKLNWTISYTYSRILVRSITKFTSDAINSGNWFPASYDKPHDISMMFSLLYSRRMSFSVNYTYNTGRPITYPVAVYQNNNMTLVEYSDRNKYRIPDYSRFDFSARFSGNLRSHKLANPAWTFSVFNLFGRENVYSVYFKIYGTQVRGYRLSIFGRAIPTVTYSFDF